MDESEPLTKKLIKAYKELGDNYKPRTEHFLKDGSPEFINRLVVEESPYLLQHAHNPVNWFAWGEEAFERANLENKPVFLSIGYATCHWCHVMERESFEDRAIADFLNEHFISIKVDREQRPDVDNTYMTAVQMMTGSGGWPLTAFLVPTSSPFYGGTYFPPDTFLDLLKQVSSVWGENKGQVIDQAGRVAEALKEVNELSRTVREVGDKQIDAAVRGLLTGFDELQGGFGDAPKFPREPALFLLLDQARRSENPRALHAAHFTLQRIAAGGIQDHIAGGFHRYAVDSDWLIPHFEKMLYNQAALARTFIQAWQITADQEHARVASRILDYVLREMTSDDGVFYSATDADSEGHEGVFFVWTPEQLEATLGKKDARLASLIWNTTEEGNFEGSNILHLRGPITEVAPTLGMSEKELTAEIDRLSATLWKARQKRIPPLRDEKIITAWNGMMITALAEVGVALGEPRYVDAARRAATGLLELNSPQPGILKRSSFSGRSSVEATQADYAFLAEALLEIYDATSSRVWLDQAELLVETMDSQFLDTEKGGYFMGPPIVAGAKMPVRPKDLYDNAVPSGNAVALRVLTRLWQRTGNDDYREKADALVAAFSDQLVNQSGSQTYFLTAVAELLEGERGESLYSARGKVRVQAEISNPVKDPDSNQLTSGKLKLTIDIADGWHINAHQPIQDYLIGTRITRGDGSDVDGISYPEPVMAKLGFESTELALYENKVVIEAPLSALIDSDKDADSTDDTATDSVPDSALVPVSINLQACNDEVCLAPETLTLTPSLALSATSSL